MYVVRKGRQSGIYQTRSECKTQVTGFAGAQYQKAPSRQEAERLLVGGYDRARQKKTLTQSGVQRPAHVIGHIAVDAACRGNPGILEYQGVIIGSTRASCQIIFGYGPYDPGSVNFGEFVALVCAMRYVIQQGSSQIIYSDSKTAMSRVRDNKVRTTLREGQISPVVWSQVQQCLAWLVQDYQGGVEIRKWETQEWGECPADFGRK